MAADPVPFLDLKAQLRPLRADIDKAIASVLDDTSFILGPSVKSFEESFAAYCGMPHCVALHSGTAALHLALIALGIGAGDEVILPANSFVATAEAIMFAGATPVFVDVSEESFNLNVQLLEAAITNRCKAIIAVHLYGQPADMDEISAVARRRNLYVIEDACQAHGATYRGKRTGSLADVACFSFYPGKNLGAAGEGGAVVTADESLATRVAQLRNHGGLLKYEHDVLGHNFRLDSIQAAILNVKLPFLDEWNQKRNEHAQFYNSLLRGVTGVVAPVIPTDRTSSFHLYVLQVSRRDAVIEQFNLSGIGYGIHYPRPIHLLAPFRDMGQYTLPESELLSERIISLPMYPELTEQQQERVVQAILNAALPDFAVEESAANSIANRKSPTA